MSGDTIDDTIDEAAENPCRKWRGEWIIANGHRFSGDCRYCGWPKPDHVDQDSEDRP